MAATFSLAGGSARVGRLFLRLALLSLSIASLAAWLGIEQRQLFLRSEVELAVRAFICTGILAVWREADRRTRANRDFEPLFEHFGTNIAFWGALILTADHDTRWTGLLIALVLAALSLYHGVRRHRELFVIYAVVYGLVAIDIVVLNELTGRIALPAYLTFSTAIAIGALITTHFRFRRAPA